MKLSILQENLAKGLNIVSHSIASRAQLPVLNNVLLTTDQGKLKLSTTNLETGINYWIGAKIEKEGSISVPARVFTEFVTSLPAEKIELEVQENNLKVNCGSYQAEFNGLPASEYPRIPSLKNKAEINFISSDLIKAINQIAFSAAQDEERPILTGVLFLVKEDHLVLVATDGYRLSLKKLPINKKIAESKEFKEGLIIPARTLIELARIIGETNREEKIGLSITKEANQISFSSLDIEIVSRLIEGKYPDFEKIIPNKGTTNLTTDVAEITRAVRVAAIFARETANIVRFKIDKKGVEISADTAQIGRNKTYLEAKVTGVENKIAFNSRYLLDLFGVIGEGQINLEMTGSLNPGVFTLKGDNSYFHIIMPIRIQE